jgi:hypothetical protein
MGIKKMGLGKAIARLNTLQSIIISGTATDEIRAEYKMILDALNAITLEIGFDCDGDGIPDDETIFKQSIETSCCRLIELDNKPDRSGMRSR